MDEQLAAWRERSLGQMRYHYLGARYEKVRQDDQVRNGAVLMAMGVNLEGKREVLGVSDSPGEHEVHWRTFLQSLVSRGLVGVPLVIPDDHSGLQKARMAVFGGVPWQRCQRHLQRNAQAYVPRRVMKREVAAAIRAIFNAASRPDAESLMAQAVQEYSPEASALAGWMEKNIPEGLTISPSHPNIIAGSGPRTPWNASTERFGAAHGSRCCSRTRHFVYGWSLRL